MTRILLVENDSLLLSALHSAFDRTVAGQSVIDLIANADRRWAGILALTWDIDDTTAQRWELVAGPTGGATMRATVQG